MTRLVQPRKSNTSEKKKWSRHSLALALLAGAFLARFFVGSANYRRIQDLLPSFEFQSKGQTKAFSVGNVSATQTVQEVTGNVLSGTRMPPTPTTTTTTNDFLSYDATVSHKDATALLQCGCPDSCNFWSLRDKPGRYICEERLDFLQQQYKTPKLEACRHAADDGHCSASCHPEKCTPFVPISERYKSHTDGASKTISFQLQKGIQYDASYDGNQCLPSRPSLPWTLSQPGQLDFITYVSTSLKILVMGDSVGAHQIGQNFQEAVAGGLQSNITNIVPAGQMPYPNNHVSAADAVGGGVAALYRANAGMLSHDVLHNGPLGVSAHHVLGLKDHLYKKTACSDVDVMILFIPCGWIGKEDEINAAVTMDTLAESVRLAGEIFGAKTVVLATVPLNNNLLKIRENLFPINQRIFAFASEFRQTAPDETSRLGDVENLLVLDFAALTLELVKANAIALGMLSAASSDSDSSLQIDALQATLTGNNTISLLTKTGKEIDRPVPLICSEVVSEGAKECALNSFSVDGMHWCMKTVGARIHAGIACLLSCIYPKPEEGISNEPTINECEKSCNDQFMTVTPIDFGGESILAFPNQ